MKKTTITLACTDDVKKKFDEMSISENITKFEFFQKLLEHYNNDSDSTAKDTEILNLQTQLNDLVHRFDVLKSKHEALKKITITDDLGTVLFALITQHVVNDFAAGQQYILKPYKEAGLLIPDEQDVINYNEYILKNGIVKE